jgi:hypothetical protein
VNHGISSSCHQRSWTLDSGFQVGCRASCCARIQAFSGRCLITCFASRTALPELRGEILQSRVCLGEPPTLTTVSLTRRHRKALKSKMRNGPSPDAMRPRPSGGSCFTFFGLVLQVLMQGSHFLMRVVNISTIHNIQNNKKTNPAHSGEKLHIGYLNP